MVPALVPPGYWPFRIDADYFRLAAMKMLETRVLSRE
jgi:hypothetical protein